MFALRQRHAPRLVFVITGIDEIGQKFLDALRMDFTVEIALEDRVLLKKAFDLGLCFKAARCKPFESKIAIHQSRLHAIDDLLFVLLTLVLRDACQHVFDKLAIAVGLWSSWVRL